MATVRTSPPASLIGLLDGSPAVKSQTIAVSLVHPYDIAPFANRVLSTLNDLAPVTSRRPSALIARLRTGVVWPRSKRGADVGSGACKSHNLMVGSPLPAVISQRPSGLKIGAAKIPPRSCTT